MGRQAFGRTRWDERRDEPRGAPVLGWHSRPMTILIAVLVWSIRLMIFTLGLRSTAGDVLYLWRRPGLLARSVLAMYVVVPAVAVLMVTQLDLTPITRRVLIVLAISAGAPLVPRRLLEAGGDPRYVLSLAITSSVLAIVTVPASLAFFSYIFSVQAGVSPTAVARLVAISFLLPFLGGVALRRIWPGSQVLVRPLTNAAAAVFTVTAVVVIILLLPLVVENGLRSFLALAALTFAALAAGHLLGGPRLEDRVALAVLCATRHIGLVMMIAFAVQSRASLAVVSAYLVAAIVVSTPYVLLVRRRLRR